MGDPKKQRKKYETSKNPWSKDQIVVETKLSGEYGLRNRRELWRYRTMLSKIRQITRSLLGTSEEEREEIEPKFLKKLSRLGILPEEAKIDNILDLDIRDLLERRLQTVVYRLGLAKTIHQARQVIKHRHVEVSGRIVSIPGYLVSRLDEANINYSANSVLSDEAHSLRRIDAPSEAKETKKE